MELSPQALVPMATLAAALLAGAIAALTLIVNKENKISEFRQAWIDGLREDLTTFFPPAEPAPGLFKKISLSRNSLLKIQSQSTKPRPQNSVTRSPNARTE